MDIDNIEEMGLHTLRRGQQGMVVRITDPQLRLALLRLGLLEGDRFCVTELAPLGGPLALRVRGGKVALRRDDARKVLIKRI